jgi:hypothetical protein
MKEKIKCTCAAGSINEPNREILQMAALSSALVLLPAAPHHQLN